MKVHDTFCMVMAVVLFLNQKLDKDFNVVRRIDHTDIQNFIGPSENENILNNIL